MAQLSNYNKEIERIKKRFSKKIPEAAIKRQKKKKEEKRSSFLKAILFLFVFALVLGGVGLSYKVISTSREIAIENDGEGEKKSSWQQIKDFFTKEKKDLKGAEAGRINILLLGVGGEGHKGEYLTDSIMVVSIRPETYEVAMLSIPRDLYVSIPNFGYSKINSAYSYGKEYGAEFGTTGPKLTKEVIQDVTSLPIHYYITLDFEGFRKAIDNVGGLDVEIKETFYDYHNKKWFKKGTEHMNGSRALWYVRARYVQGPEGSDFARSRRQQQVLAAFKNEVLSASTLLDISKINNFFKILGGHVKTDIEPWEMKELYEISKNVDNKKIVNKVLSTDPDGLLYADKVMIGGMSVYVLKPNAYDFSEIHNVALNIFDADKKEQEKKSVTIEIQNGTKRNGLATKASYILKQEGYNIIKVGNASRSDYEKTVIYDQSEGSEYPYTLQALEKKLNARISMLSLPEDKKESTADILIILGEDYYKSGN